MPGQRLQLPPRAPAIYITIESDACQRFFISCYPILMRNPSSALVRDAVGRAGGGHQLKVGCARLGDISVVSIAGTGIYHLDSHFCAPIWLLNDILHLAVEQFVPYLLSFVTTWLFLSLCPCEFLDIHHAD